MMQAFGMVSLAASCELRAAVERTSAVGNLVRSLDDQCQQRLRNRGLLGFDDVKSLMGAWTQGEDERLRREAVDFRLDAHDRPVFLEINPLPTFATDGTFAILAELEGVTLVEMLGRCLCAGLERLGLG